MNVREIRAIGQQLAEIGDRLNREWAERSNPAQWPPALLMARPAQALTRDIYRSEVKRTSLSQRIPFFTDFIAFTSFFQILTMLLQCHIDTFVY